MNITITINAYNAAFQDDPAEIGRVLSDAAGIIVEKLSESDPLDGYALLRDSNGNTAGRVTFEG
jgi:hypothetical protein